MSGEHFTGCGVMTAVEPKLPALGQPFAQRPAQEPLQPGRPFGAPQPIADFRRRRREVAKIIECGDCRAGVVNLPGGASTSIRRLIWFDFTNVSALLGN